MQKSIGTLHFIRVGDIDQHGAMEVAVTDMADNRG
jgi:hypothetical protein